MPDGFSTPAGKKFPEPVPIEMVDEARREEYSDITPDIEEPKIPEATPAAAPPTPEPEEKVEDVPDEVVSFVNDGFRLHFRKGLLVQVEPIQKEDLAQPT